MAAGTNTTLLFVHAPKVGGSTIASLFQPYRRLYRVVSQPALSAGAVEYRGGHRSVTELSRRCNAAVQCCVWLMVFRDPLERLVSAYSTSREDHQHFDCARGSLRRRLRDARQPLTLEQLALAPPSLRRSCNLHVYLDMLSPPSRLGARRLTARQRDAEMRQRLRRAKARLGRMQLVGLTERFSDTLMLLSAALRLELGAFPSVFTFNPRGDAEDQLTNLSARARRVLVRELRPEYELYRAAVARFDALWAQAGLVPVRERLCSWRRALCWDKKATTALSRPSGARDAPAATPVRTWPIADVQSSPLWKLEGRRQRVLCAAPCNATAHRPPREAQARTAVACDPGPVQRARGGGFGASGAQLKQRGGRQPRGRGGGGNSRQSDGRGRAGRGGKRSAVAWELWPGGA